MAIFITGDIHANPGERFSSSNFSRGRELTKEDYVIILGDFGLIWNKDEESDYEAYWLNWLDSKPWTTLFIDGNHENYDRLNDYSKYPCEEWCGGLVQKIRPSIIHLCRGEVFDIDGKRILAMGGAASHDIDHGIIDPADYSTREEMKAACKKIEKEHGGWQFALYRIKGESWWEQEIPNDIEKDNAIINLDTVNNKVDFILSHEAPASDVVLLGGGYYKPDAYAHWLEENIRNRVDFQHWFFGHYHLNRRVNDREECIFEHIIQVA